MQLARSLAIYTSTMPQLSLSSAPIPLHILNGLVLYLGTDISSVVEAEIAWSTTETSAKVPEEDRLGSVPGIARKSVGCGGVGSWGWVLETRAGLLLAPLELKEGLEPLVQEVHQLKALEVLGWVQRSLAAATTTKYAYGTSADLVVPHPLHLLFILLDLDLEAASALRRVVLDQIVVAMATATSPYGSSTNTLQP